MLDCIVGKVPTGFLIARKGLPYNIQTDTILRVLNVA